MIVFGHLGGALGQMPISGNRSSVLDYSSELLAGIAKSPFVVFLCGPTLNDLGNPSAKLRYELKNILEKNEFEVVLGEDDGLEDTRIVAGLNAQDNELEFVSKKCNAVIIIAASVGSFCELGLFSWHFVHSGGRINLSRNRVDLIVLIDKEYQFHKSYLNQGPGLSVKHHGKLDFVDFNNFDSAEIVERLRERRAVFTVDRRGRPSARKP